MNMPERRRDGETERRRDGETGRLNPTTLRSLRLSVSLSLCLCASLANFAVARADELHLKDGRVIEAEEVWELGDAIWYRQGKIIASFAKTEVVRITKPKTEPAANSSSNPPGVGARILSLAGGPTGSANGDEVVSRKISRIILKGGTQ